jgi:hypothetical protein
MEFSILRSNVSGGLWKSGPELCGLPPRIWQSAALIAMNPDPVPNLFPDPFPDPGLNPFPDHFPDAFPDP